MNFIKKYKYWLFGVIPFLMFVLAFIQKDSSGILDSCLVGVIGILCFFSEKMKGKNRVLEIGALIVAFLTFLALFL